MIKERERSISRWIFLLGFYYNCITPFSVEIGVKCVNFECERRLLHPLLLRNGMVQNLVSVLWVLVVLNQSQWE